MTVGGMGFIPERLLIIIIIIIITITLYCLKLCMTFRRGYSSITQDPDMSTLENQA